MMQIYQPSNYKFKKPVTMTALALVVFLLLFFISTIVHADHITTEVNNSEQQECYICHQGLDTLIEVPQIQTLFVASYFTTYHRIASAQFKVNSFVQPQLRAPPVFL